MLWFINTHACREHLVLTAFEDPSDHIEWEGNADATIVTFIRESYDQVSNITADIHDGIPRKHQNQEGWPLLLLHNSSHAGAASKAVAE